jgi:hypothetical protein
MNPENSGWKDNATLRLVWPQWQGAGAESVRTWLPEFPFEVARRGYAAGTAVLGAILPQHSGPTAVVPVELGDAGLANRDGIEAKDSILPQLAAALDVIRQYDPERIVTLGGECSVSVAPFAKLAERHGTDLAVLWIDPRHRHPGERVPRLPCHGCGRTDRPRRPGGACAIARHDRSGSGCSGGAARLDR